MKSAAPWTPPRVLGEQETPVGAYAILLGGTAVSNVVATQVAAASKLLTSSLGHPVAHLPLLGNVYEPWRWLAWGWAATSPLSGVQFGSTALAAAAPAAATAWLYGHVAVAFAGGVVLSVAGSIVSTMGNATPKSAIAGMTNTAHFATYAEIRDETNFLTCNCGPIFGDIVAKPEQKLGPFILKPEQREHLRWDGETGWNVVGVQGVGKSADSIKTNLLIPLMHPDAETWTQAQRRAHPYGYEPNILCVDSKGDLRRSTSGYQKTVLGKNVYVFSPFSREPGKVHIDTLHLIRIGQPEEFDDCRRAAVHIVDEGQGIKVYWDKEALNFAAGLIATLGYQALSKNEPWRLSHPGLIDFLTDFLTPETMLDQMMHIEHDPHGVFGWVDANGEPTKQRDWIVRATRAMFAKQTEEKSGVYSNLVSYIGQFLSEVVRLHIRDTMFDMKAAANDPEKASIFYIDMPAVDLDAIRGYLRIMFRTFFNQLMSGTVTIDGRELPSNLRSTLLFMDEIKTLNRLEPLAETSGNMRGYKVQVFAIWQERSQIEECYGKTQSLTGNLGLQKFYRTIPGGDDQWIEDHCGETTTTYTARNKSGKRFSGPMENLGESVHVHTRKNMTAEEANAMAEDEAIVFARGKMMRVKQTRYYDLVPDRAKLPPVEVSDRNVYRPAFEAGLEALLGHEKFTLLTSPAPDRWAEKREAAVILDNGCRVHEYYTKRKTDGVRLFWAVMWLPDAHEPVLNESYSSAAERKAAVKATIHEHMSADDANAGEALPIQVDHHEDPIASFLAAQEAAASA